MTASPFAGLLHEQPSNSDVHEIWAERCSSQSVRHAKRTCRTGRHQASLPTTDLRPETGEQECR